jgi:signal transduction histidine kinase
MESINVETYKNFNFRQLKERNLGVTFLSLEHELDNGWFIFIRTPLESINKSIDIFNQYLLISGAIILLISLITSVLISRHFTKPILNILETTNKIKKLDFSSECDVITNDEIGRLAENVNTMSISIKKGLDDLEKTNLELKNEVKERIRIDEQRKALLNNVSHELKTPLSLIQGYSEGLIKKMKTNQEKAEFYCEVIIDESKKMDALVSQLLKINKIQSGDIIVHKEEIHSSYIDDIVKKFNKHIKTNQIDFNYSNKSDCYLYVNPLQTDQVITNLISNAIAYVDDQKTVDINIVENEENISFTIKNTHAYMSDDNLLKLWDSFYKVDEARSRDDGGYGLGLSIIKAIQESNNSNYGAFYKNNQIHFYVEFTKKTS